MHYIVNSSLGGMKHCQLALSANMAWTLFTKRREWGMAVEVRDAGTGRLVTPSSLSSALVRKRDA